jgi:hypothetical protein
VVLCLVNVEAKALDCLCRSIYLEMSCLGTRVPAYPNEVEHHLVGGKKNFQSFTVICRKPHVASWICCAPQFFKTPKGLCGHTVVLVAVCMGKKVKQSHYRPGQALRVPGRWGSQVSRQSAHEGGKVVNPTHRPPLRPRKYSCYSFLLRDWVDPRAIVRPKGWHHRESNPRPSGF